MSEVNERISSKGENSDYDVISAVDFEPSRGGTARAGGGHGWLLYGSLGLLLLIAAAAVFVFTGRSVQLSFEPPTDKVAVDGGWFPLKVGDRWLLHPGRYQVSASLEGYEDLTTEIEVDKSEGQSFVLPLVKLPGFLTVLANDAENAHVWIDGQPISPAPLQRHELRPGSYELTVQAPRYFDYSETLEIEGGDVEQTVEVSLVPAWAEIAVDSLPAGATLYVDGDPVGETPVTAEIIEGARNLELKLDGYKEWTSRIEVQANAPQALPRVSLDKADNLVQVASIPPGASVTVDGEYRGQAPMQLALQPGRSYRVGFTKPGYQANQRLLDVRSGDDTRLQVRLQPIFGDVLVAGQPADAEVYVNGIFQGRLNESFPLPAHPQRIEVRREGYEPYSTSVTPNPDQPQRVNVALISFDAARRARNPDILQTSTGYRLKMVQPSGIFRLGSARREQGRRSNEFMRQVQLGRAFYMGLTEVTNEAFQAFTASHDSGVVERSTLALKQQPVVRVSWDQAARFCNWLSAKEGLPAAYEEVNGRMQAVSPMTHGYRLPSEAEWAYVARYGGRSNQAARKYAWGDTMPPPAGAENLAGTESAQIVDRPLATFSDAHAASAPVAQGSPNALGLYDLGGNVHEWMHDYYVIHTGGLGQMPLDPLGPSDGETYVLRGGSWRSGSITELRLAFRDEGSDGRDDIGFRVARYLEPEGNP